MHLEIQVALNFVISHLYNKLPRRRVNLFGEELEKALKLKFQNHWYPEKPMKGSAFRCLKTGQPTDAVLERAASEANVNISDILENLPSEMAVWIDPGEVSYKIGEKGQMKVLWSENSDSLDELNADHEVTKTFNPEAQIFQPIDAHRKSVSPYGATRGGVGSPDGSPFGKTVLQNGNKIIGAHAPGNGVVVVPGVTGNAAGSNPQTQPIVSPSGPQFFPTPRGNGTGTQQQMMTTAAFAQTKFGSTKLKTSSKRTHRMSPTEFSNYIKQRALQQQQQQQQQNKQNFMNVPRPRSLSPQEFNPFGALNYPGAENKYTPFDAIWSNNNNNSGSGQQQFDSKQQLLEGLSLGLNSVPYQGQYQQHLLVAN